MNTDELAKAITLKMASRSVPPRILLSRFRLIDEASRSSHASLDPFNVPFYYHLGRLNPADSLLEFGFGLGINSGCYLLGSPKTEKVLTLQSPHEGFSHKLGCANLRTVWGRGYDLHVGEAYDEGFVSKLNSRKWGVVIMNETLGYDAHVQRLEVAWGVCGDGAVLAIDNLTHRPAAKAYEDFCKIKRRGPVVVKTRYQIGLLQK